MPNIQKKYNSRYFSISDPAVNTFREALEKICDMIAAEKLDIWWDAFVKLENLDEDLLKKMNRAGCGRIKIGIESGSQAILSSMGKNKHLSRVSSLLEASSALGMENRIYMTVGYPHEKESDINDTVEFIRSNKEDIHSISIYRFHLDYKSDMYLSPEKYGIENIRQLDNGCFEFDETGGLKWHLKKKQQTAVMLDVLKGIYPEVLRKRFQIGLIPFLLYCFWEKNKASSWMRLIISMLPRSVFLIVYALEPRYYTHDLFNDYGLYMEKDCFPLQGAVKRLFNRQFYRRHSS